MLKRLTLIGLTLILGGSALTAILAQRRPDNLGVENGKLKPCPASPNCVSSQASPSDTSHYITPLLFSGDGEAAMDRVRLAVAELPRTTLVSQKGPYLRIEARTESGIFADDLEFYVDEEAQVVHFRSAARVGYSDLGVNRARMDEFRDIWQALD